MNEDVADMIEALLRDDSDAGFNYRARWMRGCNADDTTDSRGVPLRPKINDAGEPWWM
jgi:hypothetical protein